MITDAKLKSNTDTKRNKTRKWTFSPSSTPPKNKPSTSPKQNHSPSPVATPSPKKSTPRHSPLKLHTYTDLNTFAHDPTPHTHTHRHINWDNRHWQACIAQRKELMFGAATRQGQVTLQASLVHRKDYVRKTERATDRVYMCGYAIRKVVQVPCRSKSRKCSTVSSKKPQEEEYLVDDKNINDSLVISKFSEEKSNPEYSFELKSKPMKLPNHQELSKSQTKKSSKLLEKTTEKKISKTPSKSKKPLNRGSQTGIQTNTIPSDSVKTPQKPKIRKQITKTAKRPELSPNLKTLVSSKSLKSTK